MLRKIKTLFAPFSSFFPVQLLLLNLKKNQVLLSFWVILLAFVTKNAGNSLGVPYLFLDPEYNNDVSFTSLFLLGIAYGLFTMSFFITSYILDSHRYQFLGTLKKPFAHYSLNNSVIPIVFFIVYAISFIQFQTTYGGQSIVESIKELFGFIAGTLLTFLIIFLYFRKTNKDFYKEFAKNIDVKLRKKKINAVSVLSKINDSKKRYRISSYLSTGLRFKRVDNTIIYSKEDLFRIIDQHHLNAVAVEIVIFVLILGIGVFRDHLTFQIPAAASSLLLAAFSIMFTGAFSYWLRGWAITGILIVGFCFNFLIKNDYINSNKEAFGLNYNTEKAAYTQQRITDLSSPENYKKDIDSTIIILNNWKAKFPNRKPKMIFICASGGGHRAAVWAMHALQNLDKETNGRVIDQAMLMTGASGGLIGASYFRELYWRQQNGETINLHSNDHFSNMGKDILNPMIFSLVVSDFVLGFQKYSVGDKKYYKGRGYTFENQLNVNTQFVMDKKVQDYYQAEKNAQIPMVIISPSIINDGRKLYISPQKISYMNSAPGALRTKLNTRIKGIEFSRFYEKQEANNLQFMSALRMNATFPYITPNVHLPSDPEMAIMDAGLTDNFGVNDATRFFLTFKEWIQENTSGVIFLSIRDTNKNPFIKQEAKESLTNIIFNPIANMYNNLDDMQDLANDNSIEFSNSIFKNKIDVVNIEYSPKDWEAISRQPGIDLKKLEKTYEQERASLSWHLTQQEKENIQRAIYNEKNKHAIARLKALLEEN